MIGEGPFPSFGFPSHDRVNGQGGANSWADLSDGESGMHSCAIRHATKSLRVCPFHQTRKRVRNAGAKVL